MIGTTEENLAEAANGEYDEWHNLYPAFAQKAREEGFPAIAYVWDHVCVAENSMNAGIARFLRMSKTERCSRSRKR